MQNENISEITISLDMFKEELIGSINQVGNKYGLVPAVLIHILSEIVAEARASEYKNLAEKLLEQNQNGSGDGTNDETSDMETVQPEVMG